MNPRIATAAAFPLDDLDGPTADLVRQVQAQGDPVVLTRDGVPLAIVLSPDAFETLEAEADRARLQRGVEEAERQVAAGDTVAHGEVLAELELWISDAG